MAAPLYHFVPPIFYRGKVAPNLLARIQLPAAALSNRFLFHIYSIVDGDRPETVAYHYYGSDIYDWVVLLSNRIIDMRSEWPLTEQQFSDAIIKKYGSTAAAMSSIVEYKINNNYDNIDSAAYNSLTDKAKSYFSRVYITNSQTTYGITQDDYRINADSYNILAGGEAQYWVPVTAYDKEYELNEAKRNIRLIDAKYIPQLEKSLRLVSQNVSS